MFSEPLEAYAHGVNTDGVMGAGVAAVVARKWPHLKYAYVSECRYGRLSPGGMFPFRTAHGWVYNCASQDRPGANARVEWLRSSLESALAHMASNGVRNLALPVIGGGIGGISPAVAVAEIETMSNAHPEAVVTLWLYP
jgi:O-acetyl-ADP-ribose deacetylase (regulator of RNase III)